MSPNVPREDLNNAPPRSLLATVTIAVLILLGLYVLYSLISSRDDDSDPDRPPIIISSGSVTVSSGGDWIDEGLKHEYVDFLMRNRDALMYPTWFEEGFASVLSTLAPGRCRSGECRAAASG